MELGSARELKAELLTGLRREVRAALATDPTTVAVGVVPRALGFGLAVRISSSAALQLPVVEDVLRRWGGEADVRVVGRVRASTDPVDKDGDRPVDRVLHPGASVAHPDVTAGTLGGFVRDSSGRVLMISNNHVLADTDRARIGDAVLSPGPADGGRPEADRVATLTGFQRLKADGNLLDLAVAVMDDMALVAGNTVPEGELSAVLEDVLDGLAVAKSAGRPGTRPAPSPLSSSTA